MQKIRSNNAIATTGFTLIELTLVVAIIAIFCAMALPRFNNSAQRYRVDLAAKKIAADLAWCRQAARSRGQTATITFSPTTNSYTLSGGVSISGSTVPDLTVDLSKAPFNITMSAASFTNTSSHATAKTISFDPNGIPDSIGTVSLTSKNISRVISVSAPGGAITITSSE